jgi:DNA-nicking Smr family endonuclease
MSRRKTTDDEKILFQKTIDEPRPLKAVTRKAAIKPKKPAARPATGLDGNTTERLKRGALEPQAKVDLHGLTEARAHQRLLSFLRGAHKNGVRLVLVITGIGNPRRGENAEWMVSPHGVLKQMVPRWLNESEFAALVSGLGPAHRRHGGDGALYVYLRKTQ